MKKMKFNMEFREKLKKRLRYSSPPRVDHDCQYLRLAAGVELVEQRAKFLKIEDITLQQRSNQPRPNGVNLAHLNKLKNQLEGGKQLNYPIFVSVDPITGKKILEQGHHRYQAYLELDYTEIPCWIIKYITRDDGRNSKLEFNQIHGRDESSLPHGKEEAISYLNDIKRTESSYFTKALDIEDDEEKKAKISELCRARLTGHYDHLSSQSMTEVIKKFMKGYCPEKVSNLNSRQVAKFFKDRHFPENNKYDFNKNEIHYILQQGKEGSYLGLIEDLLRKEMNKSIEECKETGGDPALVRQRFRKVKICAWSYTTTSASYDKLKKSRKTLERALTIINKDDFYSPNTCIEKIYHTPQSLMPVEEKDCIERTWCKKKQCFE